ncbi:peptidylprolyl isomerase [Salmonirosea aquatica]|uniref:OmpA family protein n=1 Tax=Salmonirosea aquatica TaxID=2654236 RepID=A0A7C9FP99_9BACT|nr:OmpA family protein [Cytophagaceae bacterium SJW1-29]
MHTFRWLYIVVLAGVVASCKTAIPPQQSPAEPEVPTLVQIGDKTFSPDAFFQSFTKNRFSADSAQSLSARQYFDIYTNTKLKLLGAEAQGRDTTSDFKEEIASYREQLAAPYLTDKERVAELTEEAYNRLKQEVHAAHILVAVPEEALPADTLSAYRAAVAMRGRLLEGSDFGDMAQKFSKDATAKDNKGDLGYFTAFQMVYPFENAAYTTPVGQISEPVRTKFGYHLIKVLDRRPTRGKRRVAHVMIQVKPDFPAEKKKEAEQRIRDAYARLEKGEPWDKVVQVYSDDFQSRQSGGLLPAFGVGEMMPAFEAAAYGLDKVGDYSKPVETPYGWHIIRLVEKRPLESFATMEPSLRQKVMTDSRGHLMERDFIERLKKEYTIQENPDAWSEMLELADSSLLKGTLKIPETFTAAVENPMLFTIEKEASSSRMFLDYVKSHLVARPAGSDPKIVLRSYYNDFLARRLLDYEKSILETKYPEFKVLMNEIRDGVLLSQVMEEQVWQRSLDDSTGQRRLYEQNLEQYQYPARALATVIQAKDTTVLNQVLESLAQVPYVLRLKGEELLFEQGKTQLSPLQTNTLYSLAATLKKNQEYVVEVAGYRTADEADTVSASRISHAVRYLNSQGIPITRIMEKDYGSFRPVPEPDRNRRVSFQFFSRSKKDLERAMNRDAPGNVRITEGYFAKDHPLFKEALWEVGDQRIPAALDGSVLAIQIQKIEPPRPKTFNEARGSVINAYQKILEKQWLDSLKTRFPVQVNEKELEKLTR